MFEFGTQRLGNDIEVLGLDSHDYNIVLGKVKSNLLQSANNLHTKIMMELQARTSIGFDYRELVGIKTTI